MSPETGTYMVIPAVTFWTLAKLLKEGKNQPHELLYETGRITGKAVAESSEEKLPFKAPLV